MCKKLIPFYLLLMTMPVYAVKNFKISNYRGAHQIWFEAEDFDERIPTTDDFCKIVDAADAFGKAINRGGSSGMIRWTFDISKADGKGGTWHFWSRQINPSNSSDYMLVKGDPGDAVIPTTPPFPGGDGSAPFVNDDDRIFEDNVGPPWGWTGSSFGSPEGYVKELQNGENTMYIFDRQGDNTVFWDVFMWTDSPDYVPTDDDYRNAMLPLPGAATNPSPANAATDVTRDVVLSWKAGKFAPPVSGHKIYFSENFSDVNDRIGGVTQDANSYAPGRLALETTYYWRVDEVNGPPDYTVFQGKVWSFTTELLAYPIENITATASSQAVSRGPENTVNGSGLDNSGLLHGKEGDNNMWLSGAAGQQPTWIEFEFDKVYKLHELWVWNANDSLEPVLGFGFKDVSIEYSANGTDYTTLGTTHQFARAPGMPNYEHNTTVDMGGGAAKYVRLTANSNWGGILAQYGLSEVRFFYIPVLASEPNPDSGATDVSIGTIDAPADVTLSFRAGREAAKHNVYFSDSNQAVIEGTAPVATVTEASYGPLSLDLGKTYYWRVDEVNEAATPATWQGELWNFTTQGYYVVDDFESYNDLDTTDPQSNRIFLSWLDGYNVPTNGSIVGYDVPPFAEQSIVHSDKQAMPFFYDNSGTARYSEATLTLSPTQNWTIKGIEALSLWFKGNPAGFVEAPAGTYTMAASGVDIFGTADQFRFAWMQLTGDGSITATVESVLWVPGSSDWSKGGVMIRDTLDVGSKNAFVALTSGAGDGATFQWRSTADGTSSSSRTLTGISPPAVIKLVREGNKFTGYVFLNGQWQQEGQPATVAMGNTVYIGLALTSHSAGVTTTAVFSNVTTTGAVTGQFTQQAIGVDMPSNGPASMYVALASGGTPAVIYHDNPSASQIGNWTEWSINLQAFVAKGVNLTRVNTIAIGFGDKTNPQPGGSGVVYLDDIRLYPPR